MGTERKNRVKAFLLVAPLLALITLLVAPVIRSQLRTKAELNAKTQNHLVEVLTGIPVSYTHLTLPTNREV